MAQMIFASGERYCCLVDEDGVPDFWSTLYLTVNLRGHGRKHGTMKSACSAIQHFDLWNQSLEQPFLEAIQAKVEKVESLRLAEVKSPEFLSAVQAQALSRHCKLFTVEARRRLTPRKRRNVTFVGGGLPIDSIPARAVSTAQHHARLTVLADFLYFFVERAYVQKRHYSLYLSAAGQMKNRILSQRPKKSGGHKNADPDFTAPAPEVFEKILQIARPESPENPFTKSVRVRNYALVRTLFETGMRSGEILQLKVKHVDFAREAIKIRRQHDDPEDKWRTVEPNAKTEERDIPVSVELLDLLRSYISNERRGCMDRVRPSDNHSFIFVSQKITTGQPLSKNQLYDLVVKLGSSDEVARYVASEGYRMPRVPAPHSFRHNKNKLISDIVDQNNKLARAEGRVEEVITPEQEAKARQEIMGHAWIESAEIYNQRHIQEMAHKISREVTKSFAPVTTAGRGEIEELARKVLGFAEGERASCEEDD